MKPYPLIDGLLHPVLQVGMPRAPRQGPAGRGQRAGGTESHEPRHSTKRRDRGKQAAGGRPGNSRTVGRPSCRSAGGHERNNRSSQRTRRDKNGLGQQTERGSRVDGRDPRWSTQRAMASPAFVERYASRHRGRPRIGIMPSQSQEVRPQMVSGTLSHPAIIAADLWERVQRRREAAATALRGKCPVNPSSI